MVNIPLKRTWGDIAEYKADQVDLHLLRSVLTKHKAGIDVIAGPTTPAVAEMISPDTMLESINILRKQYDYIIIDIPHDFSPVAIHMLDIADIILLLLAPELASVRAAVAAINTYPQLGYQEQKIKLIMNRTFGQPGLRQDQIERAISNNFEVVIPYEPEMFLKAINVGKPFIFDKPRSHVSVLLENLAYSLSKSEHKEMPPVSPTPSWERVNRRLSLLD